MNDKELSFEEIWAKSGEYLIRSFGDGLAPGAPVKMNIDWIVPIIVRKTRGDKTIIGHLIIGNMGDILKSPTREDVIDKIRKIFEA